MSTNSLTRSDFFKLFFKPPEKQLFPGFFLSGFECSTFRWKDRQRKNMVAQSQHDVQAFNDYKILHSLGIGASREAVPWPQVDKNGSYDFSCIDPMISAMNEFGIWPVWDLCHYGYPDDLDPFGDEFVKRFSSYASAVATYLKARMTGPWFFTPVNEITYFSFLGGLWGWVAPYKKSRKHFNLLRINLCKAAIGAVKAIRSVLPEARMIHTDPLVQIVAAADKPRQEKLARHESEVDTYVAWDILSGKLQPELGGAPDILDIVGVNNYTAGFAAYSPHGPHQPLPENDERILPLCSLLQNVWKRYNRPLVISETSGVGETRVSWLKDLMEETMAAINLGADIQGVCLFPAISSPNWENGDWIKNGFYEVERNGDVWERKIYEPYAQALLFWQKKLGCVTMLSDEPLNNNGHRHNIKKLAKDLDPKPDKNWQR